MPSLAPLYSFIGQIRLLLLITPVTFFILATAPVHAEDGDFVWAKSMGGTAHEYGNSISVDTSGNVYTTGYFSDTVDFDPGPETYTLTGAGLADLFISKLDKSGNFLWAKSTGGTGTDAGMGIFIDMSGNVYTTGYFSDTVDFDPGPGTYSLTSAGEIDLFISKLDKSGNFLWAKSMGGALLDFGDHVTVDKSGNIYITGYFEGTADFDPGPGTFNLISAGDRDIFVSKLDSNGSFLWARSMGGSLEDIGRGIAVDSSGNVYTTGFFQDTVDFNPGPATYNLTSAGGLDLFVSKLDEHGNFVWTKSIGGIASDAAKDISLDTVANVYITGYFRNSVDFNPGPGTYTLTSTGDSDIFICTLDSGGNFVWARSMGGTTYDRGHGISVDASGNVYTTGYFVGPVDFDPGPGIFNLPGAGAHDIFVSKLNKEGNFVWAKAMGGVGTDIGLDIFLDTLGAVHTTGYFRNTVDFDPGPETFNLVSVAHSSDIFISKLMGPKIFPWPMFLPAMLENGSMQPNR